MDLVVILGSCRFVLSKSAAHFLANAGLPGWIQPVHGGTEIVAAILFLAPVTTLIGGYALLVAFGMTALVHLYAWSIRRGGTGSLRRGSAGLHRVQENQDRRGAP